MPERSVPICERRCFCRCPHPPDGRRGHRRPVYVAEGRHTEGVDVFQPDFAVVVRGYDRNEVKAVLERIEAALVANDPFQKAAVEQELERTRFTVRLRGYDRAQVDDFLSRMKAVLRM